MKIWITRQFDGSYMMTRNKPIIEKMQGTDHDCVYPSYGEPVNMEICEEGMKKTLGLELDLFESKLVNVWIDV